MNKAHRKLTNDQALEVRTLFRDGVQQKELSSRFGINQTNISCIITGRYYADVPWPPPIVSCSTRKKHQKYPGYEFDAEGNAYSFKYNKRYGRLMNLRPNDKGYLMVAMIDASGKHKNLRVNRIICTLFNGDPPNPRHQARHLNGVSTDNRAVNLAWGTQSENELDKAKHGINPVWEKAGGAKLTEVIVRKIRASKHSSRKLALKYGVTQPTIINAINRNTWKHVK